MTQFKKILAVIGITIITLVPITWRSVDAIGGDIPLGGVVLSADFCACSKNWLVTVIGPTAGDFTYEADLAELFKYGQVLKPGSFILGSFRPPGVCIMEEAACLAAKPTLGIIRKVGTSQ